MIHRINKSEDALGNLLAVRDFASKNKGESDRGRT